MEDLFWDTLLILLVHVFLFLVGLRECEKEWKRQSRDDYRKQWF